MDAKVTIEIEGRDVTIGCWRFTISGVTGHSVPVFLLDSDLEENCDADRALTHYLYGGDDRYRLCQEAILGIAGQKILAALGHGGIEVYHMNEGHSSLLGLSLLEDQIESRRGKRPTKADLATIRDRCVFTTHTPVPAGHDRFHRSLVERVLGKPRTDLLAAARLLEGDALNMTKLAFECSRYANGVAKIHQAVSQEMFPGYRVHGVTNGIHPVTWAARAMSDLFDRHIPEWRKDSIYLRYASDIPADEIIAAHQKSKLALIRTVRDRTGEVLDEETFTIGFARRGDTLQARRRAVPELGPAALDRPACRAVPAGVRRQGAPARRGRQGHDPGCPRSCSRPGGAGQDRLLGELRDGLGPGPYQRVGLVAELAGEDPRSVRDQRHEGGPERRAEPERAGRLVAGRPCGGSDRLVGGELPGSAR